jgi:SAM-dependent methyltransferase
MHELLRALPPGTVVLDIGCGRGSFELTGGSVTVVGTDLERRPQNRSIFVQADAAELPFADRSFDLIISNHSLEHFTDLAGALNEIGRVVKTGGCLFLAVPDATTISDRLYRWLARGGGHVNPFASARDLATVITSATGLSLVATRTLCTSLSCLNRCNRQGRAPRRLLLIGGGTQISLLLICYLLKLADRILKSRASVYGWAFYFGGIQTQIDCTTWTNVCVRCGTGHPSSWLSEGTVSKKWCIFAMYRCPTCRAPNLFTDDRKYSHLSQSL